MNNKLKLLLALLTVSSVMGVAAACASGETNSSSSSQSSSSSEVKKEKYTVIFVDHDDVIISEETYEEGATVEVPADPTRADADGYSYVFAGWDQEVSETATGDATYKATYTQKAIGYKVTFVADGETVGEVPYTVETESIEAPAVPEKAGYTGVWASYELATGDVTVNAIYTAIEYKVTFMADGVQVGEALTYTVEDKEITAPAVPAKDHYTGAWASYELTTGDITVNAVYTAIGYTVTFMADGVQVGEVLSYDLDNPTVSAPAVPNKEHYTGAWESYTLDGGNKVVNAKYEAIEYKVTFLNEAGETVAEIPYTVETESIEAPAVPVKEGYGGKWAAYTLDGGNKTVNAVYTLGEYTVTFMADGQVVDTATYTINNKDITEPAVPAKEHYENGRWESYTLTTGDITVNAVYDAIEYTVTFMADGVQVGEVLTYTVENKTITEPTVPAKEHYEDGAWESYELNGGNVTVNAKYDAIEYTVTFLDEAGETVGTATYTMENTAISEPAVPEKAGYTGKWADYALSGFDVSVSPEYTANTYTITYNENGGTASTNSQDVIFGDTYSLATATAPKSYQEFLGWADENGNMFVAGEAWDIAGNVTLTAVYSEGIVFETLTEVPVYMSNKSARIASFSIVDLNGNKVLQATSTTESTSDVGVFIKTEVLNEMFADSSVEYMAFDVKSGATKTGKTVYYHDNGATSWTQYENGSYDSLPVDSFKTYYFSRACYQSWVDAGVTEARFVMIGGSLVCGGESFYIDNIRPVTAAEKTADLFSFEYGGVRTNNGDTPLFYESSSGSWSLAFSNIDSTTAGFTSEIVSEGNRAFKFTKKAGDTAISFNHTADPTIETEMRAAGYVSYDLYVPAGSDAKIVKNGFYSPLQEGWNTVYAKVDATANEWTRFTDTTASTYVFDNIQFITEEEYYEKAYGFESGAGVLRTAEIGDDSTNGGVFYYYGGADATATYSFAIAEGNGTGDVATVSNPRYASDVAHSGKYSLAFDKKAGYMYLTMRTDSTAYSNFSGGFTFWIYSTTEINGTSASNFINGDNAKFNGGEGVNIPANTWTQVTVTADDISNGRFLIIQGSTEGTIYFDDFRPL